MRHIRLHTTYFDPVESGWVAKLKELERMVRDHGFKGAVINGHNLGRYLDDKFFWPIFEGAEALNIPIYLHPTKPLKPVIEASYGGFSPIVTDMLAGAGWGWHIETAIHVIRVVLAGVFDRYPNLQIVIGHMGEALPFMLQRLDVMPMAMTRGRGGKGRTTSCENERMPAVFDINIHSRGVVVSSIATSILSDNVAIDR